MLGAELEGILAEEFRDGHGPAIREPLRWARQAFPALPRPVNEFWVRVTREFAPISSR